MSVEVGGGSWRTQRLASKGGRSEREAEESSYHIEFIREGTWTWLLGNSRFVDNRPIGGSECSCRVSFSESATRPVGLDASTSVMSVGQMYHVYAYPRLENSKE